MSQVRIGVVGAGQIAPVHVKGFVESDKARVVAVCDLKEDLAIERALAWGADRYYTDYAALLRHEGLHAVVVLTPHGQHAAMALDALRAGKHVQVARPIAPTLGDADVLASEASSRGLILSVSEPDLYAGPMVDAKSYLDTGEIGQGISFSATATIGAPEGGWTIRPESWLWRFDPEKSGGGPFLFDVIHTGLLASHYMLGDVARIHAMIGRTEIYPGYYVDAPAVLQWTHRSGAVGNMVVTYCPEMYVKSEQYPTDLRVELAGTRGMVALRLSPGRISSDAALVMYRDGRVFSFGEIDDGWSSNFDRAATAFIDDIIERRQPLCGPDLARAQLAITLAARDASVNDATVSL